MLHRMCYVAIRTDGLHSTAAASGYKLRRQAVKALHVQEAPGVLTSCLSLGYFDSKLPNTSLISFTAVTHLAMHTTHTYTPLLKREADGMCAMADG